LRDVNARCNKKVLNISSTPAYSAGILDQVFSSLVAKYHRRYEVNVISTSPWIVAFENFLTDIEINALLISVDKWERSRDSGVINAFGEVERIVSQNRTSSNAWCDDICATNPAVKSIIRKIEEITLIPSTNFEHFQVLKYEIGQKYLPHHDMLSQPKGLLCGPRILTFFLYLSDVEEGGETTFPILDIQVKPKKGRALLW